MVRFVQRGNLPLLACHVLLGEGYRALLDAPLRCLGLEPIYVPLNPRVDARLSSHVDLSVFHGGGRELILASHLQGSRMAEQLASLGADIRYAADPQGKTYPTDAGLNACAMDRTLLYCSRSCDRQIAERLSLYERLVPCRQGYTKCSVLPVSENALITADAGIAAAAAGQGIEVLKLCPGCVDLPGYAHGFIGGAAFMAGEKLAVFTGRISTHPDGARISAFLSARGIEVRELTDGPLLDVGSILPLTERDTDGSAPA